MLDTGAIIGGLAGLVANVWVAIGAQLYNQLEGGLPTTTSNCTTFTLNSNFINNVSQFLPLNMSEQEYAVTRTSEYLFNSSQYQTLMSEKEQNIYSVTTPQNEINTLAEENHTFSHTVVDYIKYLETKKVKKRKHTRKKKKTTLENIVNTTEIAFVYQSNNTEISSVDSKVLNTDENTRSQLSLHTTKSPKTISSYASFSPIFKFTYFSFINDYFSTKQIHDNVITAQITENPVVISTTEFTYSNSQIISTIANSDTSMYLEETIIADNSYDQSTTPLEINKPTITKSPILDLHTLAKISLEEIHQTTEMPLQHKSQNTDKYYTNLHNSTKFFSTDMITSAESEPPYMFMFTDLTLTNEINLTNVSLQNISKTTELSFPQTINYTETLHRIHDFTDMTSNSLDSTEYLFSDMHTSSNVPFTDMHIFTDITATDISSSILSKINSLRVTNIEMLTHETIYDKHTSDINTANSFLTNIPEMLSFPNATDKSMLEIHHSKDHPLVFNLIIEQPVLQEPVHEEINEAEISKSADELTEIPNETTKIPTKADSKPEL